MQRSHPYSEVHVARRKRRRKRDREVMVAVENPAERVLDVPTARAYLGGISRTKLWTLVKREQIPVVRIDRRVLLLESDLVRFLRANRQPAASDVA